HTTSIPLLLYFNYPPHTGIYTLSLHDALPILPAPEPRLRSSNRTQPPAAPILILLRKQPQRESLLPGSIEADDEPRVDQFDAAQDRKSTRLNSSHVKISYAVFCLKKKKIKQSN